jgi:type I restriction enzyme M protein
MARARSNNDNTNSSANIGFEAKLWLAADKLRSNMDAAEYKHVVLGLIFLRYISDSFEEHHAGLLTGEGEYAGFVLANGSMSSQQPGEGTVQRAFV